MLQSLPFPRILVIALTLALSAPLQAADLRLPRIFTDNMVLQQELPVAVWGWAEAGEDIAVTFNGKTVTTATGANGRWMVRLPAMKADGKKHPLTVKGTNSQLELANVVLGEVWLCSGQSNMNRRQEIKESHPDIRLFWIAGSTTPLADDLGEEVAGWSESTPEGLASAKQELVREKRVPRKNFTEVGYVFGRRIHEERKVPVGLIMSAFGGSQVHAWTPKPGLEEEYPFGKQVDEKDTGWPIAGGSNPHPPNKKLVANRLADIALAKTYGQATEHEIFGPVYDSQRIEGTKILVDFLHVGKGLKSTDAKPLNWFEISDGTDENRKLKYVKATARIIDADTVEVSSPEITEPKFVRFGWHSLARYNLVNSDQLPAISFKTDPQDHHRR